MKVQFTVHFAVGPEERILEETFSKTFSMPVCPQRGESVEIAPGRFATLEAVFWILAEGEPYASVHVTYYVERGSRELNLKGSDDLIAIEKMLDDSGWEVLTHMVP